MTRWTIDEHESSYIRQEKLEELLENKFPYLRKTDFNVRVSFFTRQPRPLA